MAGNIPSRDNLQERRKYIIIITNITNIIALIAVARQEAPRSALGLHTGCSWGRGAQISDFKTAINAPPGIDEMPHTDRRQQPWLKGDAAVSGNGRWQGRAVAVHYLPDQPVEFKLLKLTAVASGGG
uniref:Uncharacterized protein n=1 Tax=Anopheles atroparvus TaxID=41427 RepID=A0A182IXV9_ANOAO